MGVDDKRNRITPTIEATNARITMKVLVTVRHLHTHLDGGRLAGVSQGVMVHVEIPFEAVLPIAA